jgi:hypothetical protein
MYDLIHTRQPRFYVHARAAGSERVRARERRRFAYLFSFFARSGRSLELYQWLDRAPNRRNEGWRPLWRRHDEYAASPQREGGDSGVRSKHLTFFKELMAESVKLRRSHAPSTELRVESKPEKRSGSLRSDVKRLHVAVSTGTSPVTGQADHNT